MDTIEINMQIDTSAIEQAMSALDVLQQRVTSLQSTFQQAFMQMQAVSVAAFSAVQTNVVTALHRYTKTILY